MHLLWRVSWKLIVKNMWTTCLSLSNIWFELLNALLSPPVPRDFPEDSSREVNEKRGVYLQHFVRFDGEAFGEFNGLSGLPLFNTLSSLRSLGNVVSLGMGRIMICCLCFSCKLLNTVLSIFSIPFIIIWPKVKVCDFYLSNDRGHILKGNYISHEYFGLCAYSVRKEKDGEMSWGAPCPG